MCLISMLDTVLSGHISFDCIFFSVHMYNSFTKKMNNFGVFVHTRKGMLVFVQEKYIEKEDNIQWITGSCAFQEGTQQRKKKNAKRFAKYSCILSFSR